MNMLLAILLLGSQLVGSEFTYEVKLGDSLTSIGARLGVDARVIAAANGIKLAVRILPGTVLNMDSRHIVPASSGPGIVVNIPQRMLYLFDDYGLRFSFPIAAGKRTWKTPLGEFSVLIKEEDPVWDVPPSIQAEMEREGKPVLTHVPPGPANPLGKHWLGLSLAGVGIHGTNAPQSIYSLRTHGCMRLHPDDIARLYGAIEVGIAGRTLYQPVLLAIIGDAVFLEVHPDVYRKGPDPINVVREFADSNPLPVMLDWDLVKGVIQNKDGIARDVSLRPSGMY